MPVVPSVDISVGAILLICLFMILYDRTHYAEGQLLWRAFEQVDQEMAIRGLYERKK